MATDHDQWSQRSKELDAKQRRMIFPHNPKTSLINSSVLTTVEYSGSKAVGKCNNNNIT
jgi:hypothetical protein